MRSMNPRHSPYDHQDQRIGEQATEHHACGTQECLGRPGMPAQGRQILMEWLKRVGIASIQEPDQGPPGGERRDERERMQPKRSSEVDGHSPHRLPPVPEPRVAVLELLDEITDERLESRAATDSLQQPGRNAWRGPEAHDRCRPSWQGWPRNSRLRILSILMNK